MHISTLVNLLVDPATRSSASLLNITARSCRCVLRRCPYGEQVGATADAHSRLRRVGRLLGAVALSNGRFLDEDRHELGAVDPEPGGEHTRSVG